MSEPKPILYTQAGCPESRTVRDWLTERGVPGDPDAAKDLLATGIFGTPLLVVGDDKAFGFRPDRRAADLHLTVDRRDDRRRSILPRSR